MLFTSLERGRWKVDDKDTIVQKFQWQTYNINQISEVCLLRPAVCSFRNTQIINVSFQFLKSQRSTLP